MTLQQIVETQWAKLARIKERERPLIAVESMRRFYSQFTLAGIRADQDPTIGVALAQAINSAQRGHGIGNTGIGQAIVLYSNNYDQFLSQTNLADIRQSVINVGFNIFRPGFDAYINTNANITYAQLVQTAQTGDQDAVRAVNAIETLENQKFEGQLYPQIIRQITNINLQTLYP